MKQETINEVLKFRDDRNWKQFHNPKDLAISISLEAAELLEVFQWSAEDVICENKLDKIKEELADVVNYCILMADACNLDLDEIVLEKVKRNNEKYIRKRPPYGGLLFFYIFSNIFKTAVEGRTDFV